MHTVTLEWLTANYRPGSEDWSWDDEAAELLAMPCGCADRCGRLGCYQLDLEQHIQVFGIPGAVLLGDDGRIWDGHHRIVAARRLGIPKIAITDHA